MREATMIYRFGCFQLDAADRLLYRNDKLVPLAPKVLDTLLILVSHSGHVVTREELTSQLWPDTFVGEGTLTQCISLLRKALGDEGKWIENHPRRGYRFSAIVDTHMVDALPVPSASHSNGHQTQPGKEDSAGAVGPAPPCITAERYERAWWDRLLARKWSLAALIVLLTCAGWLSSRQELFSTSAAVISPASRLVRLTSTSGLNTDPAVSPDGTLFAYASDRGGTSGFDIWVQPVSGGDPLRLSSGPGDETEPSFSPDGTQIVFSERDSGVVKLVGTLGGEPRIVVSAARARMPRFSPDGRWIVFWTGFLPTVVARGLPGATGSVFIVPASGGSAIQIAPRFASARYPVWSPDSRHVLFLGEENAAESTYDWYVAAIDGSRIGKTGAIDSIRALRLNGATPVPGAWRAADDAVVFATNETNSSNIWQIQVSGSTGRVAGSPQRLTFGTAMERAPSVSASGRVVFTAAVEKLGVWRVRLDPETGVAVGPPERVTDGAGNERLRNVSRDGSIVSFISSRSGRDEVWIRHVETGRERQLTWSGGEDATLTPDGNGIAFSRRELGKHQLNIVDTTGGPSSKLCDDCGAPADWSPDGKRLLFQRRLLSELVVYDMSSQSEAVAVTNGRWSLSQARFSPDGAWVAFHTANSPELRQVYAAPVSLARAAGLQAWVPVVTDHGCHPNWSADGSLLYHFSFRDGAFCPWVQRIDSATKRPMGQPRVVQHLHQPRLRAALGAAATNDVVAGYFYMTITETTGNIWMLDAETTRRRKLSGPFGDGGGI